MFDLEKEIKKWKKSLYKHEVFEDGLIADLELHLREAYEDQKLSGFDDETAFIKAHNQVGKADNLAAEYGKNQLAALNRRFPFRLFHIQSLPCCHR